MSADKQAANPFAVDPSKMFEQFDPNKVMGEFTKAFSEFKIPGVDNNLIVESQRKNLEALAAANKLAVEGMQSVFQRQAEIMNTAMQEMQSVFKDLGTTGEPQDKIAEQTDLVKTAVEKALENMKELAAMAGQTNSQAFETIHARFTESLDEVKAEVLKTKT
jgi:phasin family protein